MTGANLSPIEIVLEKQREAKRLPSKIHEKIFDLGVKETAETFNIKPEEAVKLIFKILRKKNETERLQTLTDYKKLNSIYDKIEELQTTSTSKIYEACKSFAEVWEIVIAKHILKGKLKQEYYE